jgi:2'-5' RNA ligase
VTYQHRYLFCLKPPLLVARRMGLLRDKLGEGARTIATPRLHLTLARTIDYDQPQPHIAEAMRAIGALADAAPFHLSLDRLAGAEWGAGLRPSKVPPALRALQCQLDRHLAASGLRDPAWTFNPHVALLFGGGARPFLRSVEAYAWEAGELLLVWSVVGARKHIELGRWPLEPRQHALAF